MGCGSSDQAVAQVPEDKKLDLPVEKKDETTPVVKAEVNVTPAASETQQPNTVTAPVDAAVAAPAPSTTVDAAAAAPAVTTDTTDSRNAAVLRIVHVNDVYLMDEIPSLKTLIDEEKAKAGTTITTLAGDFIMPSVLSGMDSGKGIIDALNSIGLDYVCFGNHECDISNDKLIERIKESKFTWLNSNMPGFQHPLPETATVECKAADGTNTRKIGLWGACLPQPAIDFGGAAASMEPIAECAKRMAEKLKDHDAVLPITHQDQPDDEALAAAGHGFPVVLGGHDHFESYSQHGDNGCWVMKAGADAHKACVIELTWPNSEAKAPEVTYTVRTVADSKADTQVQALCDGHMLKVKALEAMPLVNLRDNEMVAFQVSSDTAVDDAKVPRLDSTNVRFRVCSMGTMLASSCKEALNVDSAMICAGVIKGETVYSAKDLFSMASLKKEVPKSAEMVKVNIKGSIYSDAVKLSRSTPTEEVAWFAQCDNGVKFDSENNMTEINGAPFDANKTYLVAFDWANGYKYRNNSVMNEFIDNNPGVFPTSSEWGIPMKVVLIEHFVKGLWRKLPKFDSLDTSGDGHLSSAEVEAAYIEAFGLDADGDGDIEQHELEAFKASVDMLIKALDKNQDGSVSRYEYENMLGGN